MKMNLIMVKILKTNINLSEEEKIRIKSLAARRKVFIFADTSCTGSIGILINYFKRRECYTRRWRADMHRICDVGSDYRGGAGAQILFYSEFHHIIGTAFFISASFYAQTALFH